MNFLHYITLGCAIAIASCTEQPKSEAPKEGKKVSNIGFEEWQKTAEVEKNISVNRETNRAVYLLPKELNLFFRINTKRHSA